MLCCYLYYCLPHLPASSRKPCWAPCGRTTLPHPDLYPGNPACLPAGTGNLTRHLLAAGALVTAVEKDYALSDQLAAEFAEVLHGYG